MAMYEFLRNIQTARNVALFNQALVPGRSPLSLMPNLATLRRVLGVILSPRVVAGYEPSEFGFLDPAQQKQLAAAVNSYREVAECAASRELTDEELIHGMDHLFTIINLIDKELLDTEGKALIEAVGEAGGKEPFPDFVLGLDYTLDTDWTGDAGIWLWVIVPDELDPDAKEFGQFVIRFPKIVRDSLKKAKIDGQAYIHYRLLSEATGAVNEEVV